MRKFDLKYLYSAGAAAALTAAAIAIPAWADSGGGQGEQPQAGRSGLPMPPPPGAMGFFARGEGGAQSAEEAREHLDELTDCMRENGVDVPHASSKGGGFSIQVPPPEARSAMQGAAKECGLPAPPPRGQLPPLSENQREQAQKAMKSLSTCMRSKGEDLPMPPPLPPQK
jgi:hypothetical protein